MKVSLIIPAYNEEKTIGDVIYVAQKNPFVDEIVVVNDGSTDKTPLIAKKMGVNLINLGENKGKGYALYEGVKNSIGDIVIFLDADLIDLKTYHITELIKPIIEGEYLTTCGIFEKGRFATDLSHKLTPFLSGQRAIIRNLWENFKYDPEIRYGFEITLSDYFWRNKIKVKYVVLEGVTQLTKEEKIGTKEGRKSRIKMYKDIARSIFKIAKDKL
ncbi:MAG TPA: glycosyltransferase family 2 protein [Caldisericia bacterium]|nr:glycosyltransferase family 2 protein [Caldisericia bacterium]HON82749.1 glycosyltransferase family 2 protein [Caldisericia bacterium]HPC56943.1 glycosyltransferase family 2 protein [Caldisericia bacterium]HRT36797.1 glycosyltransferase family 2 protein [Caldisericia bacterium]HRU73454.1 glycosyltransferase family 2 protein [Caldisericia bacterium]